MTQKQLRQLLTCNKFLISIIYVLIGSCFVPAFSYGADYDNTLVLRSADSYLKKAQELSVDSSVKERLLKNAYDRYNLALDHNPGDIYSIIRLGVVCDEQKKDTEAKEYFYKALGIDKNNPELNFRLGNFYYSRHKYLKALFYYKTAFYKGYKNSQLSINMSNIYEKFGDDKKAGEFSKNALSMK